MRKDLERNENFGLDGTALIRGGNAKKGYRNLGKRAFRVASAVLTGSLFLSSFTVFSPPPTQAVENAEIVNTGVDSIPVIEVTESELDFVEATVSESYIDSGVVSEQVGDEQQLEAVLVDDDKDGEDEVDVHIARADIESDIVVVGATWDLDTLAPYSVHLRYLEFGVWSKWTELDAEEIPSVKEGVEPTRAGTEPFTLTNVQAVEVVARAESGESLPGLNLTVIDSRALSPVENVLADSSIERIEETDRIKEVTETDSIEKVEEMSKDVLLDTEGAIVAEEASFSGVFSSFSGLVPSKLNPVENEFDTGFNGLKIKTRKAWGANESWMKWKPQPITIKGAVVHHTEGNNNYTQAQVPGQIQGVYRYHAQTLGWGDIGYNLVVDKFGGVWEGRAGGLTKATQGAQAYGANAETFGISVFGNYMHSAPPVVSRQAMSKAIAWKLQLHGVKDISGSIRVPGSDKRGRNIPVVSGHRDVGGTDCPGNAFYAQMGTVRSEVSGFLKAPVVPPKPPVTPPVKPVPGAPSSSKVPGWDAGNIISDASFFKPNAMSESQINSFIVREGASCKSNSVSKTTCLKDSKFPTQNLVTDRGGCKPLKLSGNQTPAKIISETSKACGLNPQVILTMIQKESSGIYQAKTASGWAKVMGSACPTGQACDPAQAGFQKQVYYGADKLVSYKLKPSWWPYVDSVGKKPVTIPYSSNASCGSQTFTIKNVATASLYTYNPFVPNQAALDAYPGGGGGCQHTGNRNFYMYMKKWFPESMGGSVVTPNPPVTPKPAVSPVSWLPKRQIGHGWPANVVYPGDWNKNGYADMMLINSKGDLMLYRGKANEKFYAPTKIGNGWQVMDWVGGGADWNGDGNMDLLARVKKTGDLRVYTGNGRGGFSSSRTVGKGWGKYKHLAVSKTASGNGLYAIDVNRMIHFPASKNGVIQPAKHQGTGWEVMTALTPAGDWNKDGIPDLLVRERTGKLFLYAGRADGLLGARVQVGSGWNGMRAIGVSNPQKASQGVWSVGSDGKLWSYKIR